MSAGQRAAPACPSPDRALLLLAAALLAIGLVTISSASIGYAEQYHGGDLWYYSRRHGMYLVLALALALLTYRCPVLFWYRSSWLWLLLSSLLLILVLVPGVGRNVNGAQRWLVLGPLTLQASEVAKVAVLLFLAGYLKRHQGELRQRWQGFLRPLLVLGLLSGLLLLEPDFGATVIVMATAMGMLFLAGVRLSHLAVIAAACAGAVWWLLREPYRLKRLTAYTDPWEDPFGDGFQLIQSLIAFGRGEWFGVGLGNSVMKLLYLPEAHTDFVFAIWAEEHGFLGSLLLVALFVALVLRIFRLGRRAQCAGRDFAAYLCFGVALLFSGQAVVNMGASSGMLPTKGLTLPLVSYGGSSLLCCCVLLAMVLRVEAELRCAARGRQRA